ncbi:hypothetical protein TNIN_368821 [Trichonephila inaurata madagascariensis]|uniref:Uncharacterized protein n=1 Tax=Trichonephila inaurata madagascariensis TaxID=2747483 RepID=A0A8X6XS06_9ARAC|nr:hypothetical protein TNIN_368821 [Trichonephila inaurata madagascariensis]
MASRMRKSRLVRDFCYEGWGQGSFVWARTGWKCRKRFYVRILSRKLFEECVCVVFVVDLVGGCYRCFCGMDFTKDSADEEGFCFLSEL